MKILQNVYILYVVVLISLLNIGWFVYYNNYNSIIAFVTCGLTVYLMNHNMIIVLGISMIIVNTLSMFNLVKIINKEGFKEGKKNHHNHHNRHIEARIESRERQYAREIQEAQERANTEKVERDRIANEERIKKEKREIQRQREEYHKALQRAAELKRQAEIDAANEIIRIALEKARKKAEEERLRLKRIIELTSPNQTPIIIPESFKNKNDYDSDNENDSYNENDIDDEQTKYMNDKTIINKLKKLDPIIMDLLNNVTHEHIDTINKTINHITGGNIVDR